MIRSRQRPRVGGGSGASGSLALRLDFMSSTSLDQRITFSRGTNATLIDSTGQLTYAPSNMFLNSESFTAAVWSPTGLATTPVISNTIAAPDGTITADKIVENNVNTAHYTGQTTTYNASTSYTASIYAKAAERQYVQIILTTAAFGATKTAGFDLSGSGATVTTAGTTSSITFVGNGWYRCSITATTTAAASTGTQIRIADSLSTTPASYLGDGTSGLYLWGAQLGAVTYETEPRKYNSTTPKNLLGYTEEFNNAAWTKTNLDATTPIVVNATTDPNGYLNADKIVANNVLATHSVGQGITVVSGQTLTGSVYVKAAEYNFAYILLLTTFAAPQIFAIDLTTGNPSTTSGSPLSTSVTNADNGWWRISITQITNAAGTATMQVRPSTSGTTSAFTGDGTSGIYAWGAQLSDSASVDPYVYNPAAALTSTAYYGPRFDYDPNYAYSTNNLIPYANPQDLSNISFWFRARSTAPATTATTDPAGTYTAYKLTEDTTASNSHLIQWQGNNTAVTAGVQYTFSGYVKLADAARSAIQIAIGTDNGAFTTNGGTIDITPSSSGGTGAVSGVTGTAPIVTDAGNGWWRWSITATAQASAICVLRLYLIAGGTNSYTGDGTSGAYIWGAQLVTGAAPVPFFYYPLNPLGLLIEEARTNLLLNSATLSTQNITTTAQAYTLSFYGTGTVTLSGTSTAGPLVGTGLFPQRASLTFTPTAGTLTLTVTGTVSNAQLEAGSFATSYIPTAGASVTRSADNATMVSNNFTNWYNQNQGTFNAKFIQPIVDAALFPSVFAARQQSGNNSQNTIEAFVSATATQYLVRIGNIDRVALSLGSGNTISGTNRNIATAYKVNDFASSYDGTIAAVDTSGIVANFDILNIGWSAANAYVNTRIKSIIYYNTRLPDTQLQALTL